MGFLKILAKVFPFRNSFTRSAYRLLVSFTDFFHFRPLLFVKKFIWLIASFLKFSKVKNINISSSELYPCLFDNTETTPIEPVYFYQDCWFAKHIFNFKPSHHYDIGSNVKTLGILSQFVPITMIDIRPVEVNLPNFYFKKGSILALPFKDNSIESISSLCVIEHIGLGRYGDPIDSYGSEKAIEEIKRVVKEEGLVFISVPVDSENKVYFNAHRAFTRKYIMELFNGFELLDEKYIYGMQVFEKYDPGKGFGTGLFLFRKSGKVK